MIDWKQVNTLKQEVGADDFDEVVGLFFEEVEELVVRLRGSDPLETIEANLHALKGSAMNMGFNYFAGLCQRGESLAAAGQAELIDLPAILQGFVESKEDFMTGPPRTIPVPDA